MKQNYGLSMSKSAMHGPQYLNQSAKGENITCSMIPIFLSYLK